MTGTARIRIRKGLDLPISGQPGSDIEPGPAVTSVALLGRDFVGLKPRMLVRPGDRVQAGQPLFQDKRDPAVQYTAPGSGTVASINRGNRRRLLSVVIDLDKGDTPAVAFDAGERGTAGLDEDRVRDVLCRSGLWAALRSRPFGRVPPSASRPRSIFVTAIDTHPLSADPAAIVAPSRAAFEAGLAVLACLTDGPVHLCTAPGWPGPTGDPARVRHTEFSGPHPAGLPGTHIHFLDPVSAGRIVWHIGYQDVLAIGRLFSEGLLDFSRVVALGGPGFERPMLLATRAGASIDDLCAVACGPVDDCPADFDDDGLVGTTDLLLLLGNWGACPAPCPPSCDGDLDGDCDVDASDLLAFLAAWGPC